MVGGVERLGKCAGHGQQIFGGAFQIRLMAGKTLEEHFRAQAELIDARFAPRTRDWDDRTRRAR